MRLSISNFKNKFHNFLKKREIFFYWFLVRNIFLITAKYLNVVNMIIVFFIKPSQLYKLSWRRCLPSPRGKDKYKENLIDLYKFNISTNFKYKIKNTNIYCRGFDEEFNYLKSNILVNFRITTTNKESIFTTTDLRILKYYINNNVNVIYIRVTIIDQENNKRVINPVNESQELKIIDLRMYTNNTCKHFIIGSGIAAIIAFYLLSNKTKLYGWNHYQNKKLSSMNLIEFIFKIFFYSRDFITKDCVEYSLIHLFFAYFLKDLENLQISGNIDYYENQLFDKLITKRLIKIFCN